MNAHASSSGAVAAALAAVLALIGCDVEHGLTSDHVGSDATASDSVGGGADTLGAETADSVAPETKVPSAAGEQALTRGDDGDDLFPSIAGDDLTWVRLRSDRTGLGPGETATDCLSCPWCGTCVSEIRYKHLPNGEEQVLASEYGLRSAPEIGDGRITWCDTNGVMQIHALATGRTDPVPQQSYANRAPIPLDDRLWWYGYDPNGNWGLVAYDVATAEARTAIVTTMNSPWWGSGGLNGVGIGQPFVLGSERVVWSSWEPVDDLQQTYGFVIHSWPYAGITAPIVAIDPARDHAFPLLTDNDTLVTANYLRSEGCSVQRCDLALTAYRPTGGVRELTPGGKPSLLVDPVVTGNRVAWLDYRDGRYQIWSIDLASDRPAARLTSEVAQVGTLSTIAAGTRGVVWADHRSGHWRLFARAW